MCAFRLGLRSVSTSAGAWAAYLAWSGRWDDPVAFHVAHADSLIRPIVAQVLPAPLFVAVYSAGRSYFINMLARAEFTEIDGTNRPTKAFGLVFRNDLGNAAGLDKDGSMLDFNYRIGAGFAIVGTVLARPHSGNLEVAQGRWNPMVPLPSSGGAMNSLGLPSKGVTAAVANIAAFRARRSLPPQVAECQRRDPLAAPAQPFPIGVSIMGHPHDVGDAKLAGILKCVRASLPVADFIEINESCPNVGTSHGASESEQRARIRAIVAVRDAYRAASAAEGRPRRRVPVLVKLGSIGADDAAVRHTLVFMEELGVDGVVALNTQTDHAAMSAALVDGGHSGDAALLAYFSGAHGGGVSGAPIAAKARDQIAAAARIARECNLKIKLVHVGGIATSEDVATSRAIGGGYGEAEASVVPLREWYTGYMRALGAVRKADIYKQMTQRE